MDATDRAVDYQTAICSASGESSTAVGKLYAKFRASLCTLLRQVDTKLIGAAESYHTKLSASGDVVFDYLDTVEIQTVMRGSVLSGQLMDATDHALDILSTEIEEATIYINTELENIQYDYQAGMELAVEDFNDGVNAITGWTTALSEELTAVSPEISTAISSTHTAFSDKIQKFVDLLPAMSSDETTSVRDRIDAWSKDRPIISLTGFVQLPNALYRGENNSFKIGFNNSGNKKWTGWAGLRLVLLDDDGVTLGSWDSNIKPVPTPTIESGQSQVFEVSVRVPSDVDDGSSLKIYLLMNTV